MTLPARALRTGTAVLPWPGSNAIATPAPPVTDPAWVSAAASRDGRDCRAVGSATPRGPCAWRAARHAGGVSTARGSSAMAANPAPRMARLTSTPGCGSASRAGPIGISGDAAMATATATMAPVTVTIPSRASDRVTSAARFTPSARRMGNSAASSASWRLSSWPMTASAISPASPAKTASATASGLMARSVALTWSDRLMVMMFPVVSG